MNTKTLKKQKNYAFGKNIYLLGKDSEGINYWLEEPKWDCGWYWGFGYIETYTNNRTPNKSKDISSHQHVENFLNWWKKDNPILTFTTFTEKEGWELTELFERFYMFKKLANYYNRGNMHITSLNDNKQDTTRAKEINEIEIPYITQKILNILNNEE